MKVTKITHILKTEDYTHITAELAFNFLLFKKKMSVPFFKHHYGNYWRFGGSGKNVSTSIDTQIDQTLAAQKAAEDYITAFVKQNESSAKEEATNV